jgi:hypothetical protein
VVIALDIENLELMASPGAHQKEHKRMRDHAKKA